MKRIGSLAVATNLVASAASFAFVAAATATAAAATPSAAPVAPRTAAAVQGDGWYPTITATPNHASTSARPDVTEPPGGSPGCPTGMTPSGAYSCLEGVRDLSGHLVIIRYGRSGSSGFGYLHAYLDHNLDLQPIVDTVAENPAGTHESGTKYSYTETHFHDGEPDQYVVVYEDRSASVSAQDTKELGLLTAYCQTGQGVTENKCPDWVNTTL